MPSPRALAIVLISSTHVSLCAGSLLSVLLALFAQVAQGDITITPMTPALGGSVCLLETPSDPAAKKETKNACGEGKQCFESVALSIHKGDVLVFPTLAIRLPDVADAKAIWFLRTFTNISSPNRPPGRSRVFALSVAQRE